MHSQIKEKHIHHLTTRYPVTAFIQKPLLIIDGKNFLNLIKKEYNLPMRGFVKINDVIEFEDTMDCIKK